MTLPLISVCIPVYNGAKYLEETLEKIYFQTYKNIEILISVDLSSDNSVAICKRLKKANAKIFIQPFRLGWVSNCNFLISQSHGAYFSIIPQDDLIPYNYYEKLLEGFNKFPAAVNCYPYIVCFGTLKATIHQKSIIGTLKDRIQDVLYNHFPAVSFRGLIKNKLPAHIQYLKADQHQNMMADSIWILQHALAGDLHAMNVPYYKRYHEANEHTSWMIKSIEDKISAWTWHCATLYNLSFYAFENKNELYQQCVHRLLNSTRNNLDFSPDELTTDLLDKFDEKIIKCNSIEN